MEIWNKRKTFIIIITSLFFVLSLGSFGLSIYSHNIDVQYEKQRLAEEAKSIEFEKLQQQLVEQERLDAINSSITKRIISIDGTGIDIPTEGKAVFADLTEMKIKLINDGKIEQELNILAKGKEGSRYETPIGVYKVLTKEVSHPVSIGNIYMPYSMQFFGNFFIHGMPHYANGVNIRDGDSGGCIRLSNENSKIVFDFVKIGTPVFIIEPEKGQDTVAIVESFHKDFSSISVFPEVDASSYVVADIDTGFVFAEKSSKEKMPISSLTNIMTAVISDEIYRDDRKVPVNISGDHAGLNYDMEKGDVLTITQMLRPLLIGGKDVAGDSIAHSAGKSMFIGLMNIKAKALKMSDTKFSDVISKNPENVSTASDMFRLVSYFYRKHSYLSKVTTVKSYKIDESSSHKSYSWTNNSTLLDQSVLMTQHGETEDLKHVATSIFNVPINGKDRKVAVVILGSSSKDEDTLSLVNWLKDTYKSQELGVNY